MCVCVLTYFNLASLHLHHDHLVYFIWFSVKRLENNKTTVSLPIHLSKLQKRALRVAESFWGTWFWLPDCTRSALSPVCAFWSRSFRSMKPLCESVADFQFRFLFIEGGLKWGATVLCSDKSIRKFHSSIGPVSINMSSLPKQLRDERWVTRPVVTAVVEGSIGLLGNVNFCTQNCC